MALTEDKIKKIKPLQDRVLVKRLIDEQDKTVGGIYIPDQAKEKAQIGTVISVGNGKILASGALGKMTVKEDDKVFFGKYSGTEISEEYLILREDEILGIL